MHYLKHLKNLTLKGILLFLPILVAGCVSEIPPSKTPPSRYSEKFDSYPNQIPDLSKIENPIPKSLPKSRYGNPKSYTVFNKLYHVLPESSGYSEEGIASWYGTKFHGHITSNGEIYNMYEMTAAHKSLPLPTYVKVTNLDNNKSVIVKTNDRGPFHEGRIIDLSYVAAKKIDMLEKGTARVRVEAIDTSEKVQKSNSYYQIGAFKNYTNALSIKQQFVSLVSDLKLDIQILPVTLKNETHHKVLLGPYTNTEQKEYIEKRLKERDIGFLIVNI